MDQIDCQSAAPADQAGQADRRVHLLVIDDDPTVLSFVSGIARQLGFVVNTAGGVPRGIELLSQSRHDVVMLDLNLGTDTGVEVLEHAAGLDQVSDVILMSGCDSRVLRTTANLGRSLGLNVRTVLPKPLRIGSLRKALSTVPRAQLPLTVADIDWALEAQAFHPYFQPQIAQADGRLVGAEALVRWHHPERGIVSPAQFVPLAEQEGRLTAITSAVLREALGWCRLWQQEVPEFTVSVNIPPTQVTEPGFVQQVEKATSDSGLQPRQVVLEITESSPLTASPEVVGVLSRLRIKGFGLALDDFGTGYSSLIGLYRMPFSELKVDQSFVRGIRHDNDAHQIVKATIALAHALGLNTVVEGVEDAESLAIVRGLGAHVVQGYHYSPPMPAADFAAWYSRSFAPGDP